MTAAPRRHPGARELFDRMLEQPSDVRAAFLAQQCGADAELRAELASLLRLHEAGERTLRDPSQPVAERAGDRIGNYKLLQPIGEGGFGTVWMAEQEQPVQRKVALKVLKAGMDTAQVVARFEAERQALARMDHPNIAQVFDGGSTPLGRPFFVMELVRGVPITRYCDEASLSPRERLELFIPVCQAVQHAHHKGVIHRDIKPGNVLVTLHDGKPVPKVIDFGIAKATQGRLTDRTVFTEFRQMLGTPEYMAPEQAEMSGLDIDTRADVYSLGVLLYELLTGARPFDFRELLQAGYGEMLRTIREVEPKKPSTRVSTLGEGLAAIARHRRMHPRALGSLMRGDLDWIVMRTLEKERNRRYATPTALAEDVQRYLRREPVLAGPPSRLYRLRKYVLRHRFGVAASTAIAVSLAAGAIASGWGWHRAIGEARSARIAATRAERVVALLDQMLGSADPHSLKRPDYTVRQLLDDFEREFTGHLQGEPEVEAGLRATLSGSYAGLGLAKPARRQAERAKELRLQLHGARSVPYADSLLLDCLWLHIDGRYDDATAVCAEAVAILRDAGPEHTGELVEALLELADFGWHLHHGVAADAALDEAMSLAADSGREAEVTDALDRRGALLAQRGELVAAEATMRQALERRRRSGPGASLRHAGTLGGLATVLDGRGALDEARCCAEEALRMAKEAAGDEHPSVLRHSVIFGDLQVALGLPDEAMRTLTSAVEALRRILGASNPALAIGLRSLARAEAASHRLTDAERHARESLQIDMRMTKGFSTAVADGHMALAAVLVRSSQLAEAIQHARVGLTTRQRVLGDSHADVSQARIELAQTLELAGHRAEAEAELRLAQAALQGLATVYPQRWELVGSGLASVLLDCGRVDEAEPLAVAALAGASARLPVGHPTIDHLRVLVARVHAAKVPVSPVAVLALEELLASRAAGAETPDTVGAQAMLGRSQFHRGDLDTAERTLRATLAAQERVLPPDSLPWATTLNDLGLVLEAKGVLVEAEQVLQRSLTIYRSRLGDAHEWLANTLASLAKVRLGQGNAPEAERCYREALTMREQLPGEHGPAKARCLHGIGDARRIAGDLPEAATFLRQALDLRRQHFQAPDEEVANNLNTLGMVAMQLGALDEAVPWLREALETYRQLRAPWGRLWPVVINFGMALEASGDAPIAEELYRDQLAIVRGEDHDGIDRANVSAQLGQCLLGQGRADEAEPLLAECYTLRCELMPDDWRRYVAASQLGAALLANGKPTDALPLLLEAVQKMRPPASLADRKLVAMQRLVAAYDAAGKPEEAEAWRQKLAALQPRR